MCELKDTECCCHLEGRKVESPFKVFENCTRYTANGEQVPPAKCCPPMSFMAETCSGCIYQFYGI